MQFHSQYNSHPILLIDQLSDDNHHSTNVESTSLLACHQPFDCIMSWFSSPIAIKSQLIDTFCIDSDVDVVKIAILRMRAVFSTHKNSNSSAPSASLSYVVFPVSIEQICMLLELPAMCCLSSFLSRFLCLTASLSLCRNNTRCSVSIHRIPTDP